MWWTCARARHHQQQQQQDHNRHLHRRHHRPQSPTSSCPEQRCLMLQLRSGLQPTPGWSSLESSAQRGTAWYAAARASSSAPPRTLASLLQTGRPWQQRMS
jgi:hypothetical protein